MELSEYHKEFVEDVRITAESDLDGTVSAFVNVASLKLVELGVIADCYPSFFVGKGRRSRKLRIDGYYYDEWDKTLTVIIAEYQGCENSLVITKTAASKLFAQAQNFVEEVMVNGYLKNIEISHPAYDLGETIVRCHKYKNLKKVKVVLVTDKIASDRIKEFENVEFSDVRFEFQLWDISRFYRICSQNNGEEPIEIDFREYNGKGIVCVEAEGVSNNKFRCFLGVIPGVVLADLYDKYGSQLLEGNVRAFLSVRGKVNKSIRSTIISEEKAPLFFALNNGIAATATEVRFNQMNGKTYLTYAKNLQIVNGGQTTASLSNTRYKDGADLRDIFVQMKLTELESDFAEELIPQISKSSNSQNKVSEADFFSNHPFHVRFEQFSRRIFAPAVNNAQYETKWFYERARGQYNQQQLKLTKAEKRKFSILYPKKQLVTKTDLAKVWNSWQGYPNIVSKGAQANFIHFANAISKVWDNNDTIFNEVYYRKSIALMILFRHTEKLIPEQDWYEKGYRANIVTYTLAMLAMLISKQFPNNELDFLKLWNDQATMLGVSKQLAKISKAVFESITSADRETVNVTQWCKRDACWEKMQKLDIKLDTNFEKCLINIAEAKIMNKDASNDQKMLNGIEAQMFIVQLGKSYWKEMLEWARAKKIISAKETQILSLASNMSAQHMPNAFQAKRLQEVRNKLMLEGFRKD